MRQWGLLLKTRGDRISSNSWISFANPRRVGLEFSKIDSRAAIQFKGGETEAMKD
jgi:hypothetical protein